MADEFTPEQVIEAYINGYPGMIRDYEHEEEFLASLENPDFKYAATHLLGDGKGKLSLPFISVLEFDPNAYEEAQTTGDCQNGSDTVRMADGSLKQIKDIEIGEYVISGFGYKRKVIDKIKKPYNGHMVKITTDGNFNICSTPDHRYLIYTDLENEITEWKPIGKLKVGDIVILGNCVDETETKIYNFDMADFCGKSLPITEDMDFKKLRLEPVGKGKVRCKGGRYRVNRHITLDNKLAWLVGMYAAEGGIDGDDDWRITYNLGGDEYEVAERIRQYCIEIFDVEPHIYKVPSKPTVIYARIDCKIISQFFRYLCNGNTYTKSLANEMLTSPKEIRLSAIKGWIEGDGHLEEEGGRSSSCTVSEELMFDMFSLANSCGVRVTRYVKPAYDNHKQAYNLYFTREATCKILELNNPKQKTSGDRKYVTALGQAVRINKIEQVNPEDEYVYCIGVDIDHSFICKGFIISNCVSHGTRNAIDVSRAIQIVNGSPEGWLYRGATEVIYGARGHGGQGMDPSRAAKFVNQDGGIAIRQKYGNIDLSRYNASLGAGWGSRGIPKELVEAVRKNQVGTVTRVSNAEEVADALANGYGVSVGSDVGFTSTRDENGFSRRSGSWNHQMSFIGADNTNGEFALLCNNSWGAFNRGPKTHGQPDGSFWVHEDDANVMLKQGGGYAYSMINGFPPQALPDYGTGSFF